jgi:putative hydrolase of the HAD superfamily
MIYKSEIKIIGFDADDTLWVNEPYFQDTENLFCELLSGYMLPEQTSQELLKTEMENINLYGYGAKSFILSMVETALRISNNQVSQEKINKIISLGKELLSKPIVLLDGVQQVLAHLHQKGMKLIVASKGDLLDQERKLSKSNIEKYFHHVEIMSDKKESDYLKLLSHLEINPENFLMIGNSLKSDIIPVLNIGGSAIHIPYHITWQYEKAEDTVAHIKNFVKVEQISDVLKILSI